MKPILLNILLVATLFITGCARYYYKPNTVNVPLFTDKGQAHINIAGGNQSLFDSDEYLTFFDVQAAGSPVKHLGIMANYSTQSYHTSLPDFASGNVPAKGYIAEAGIGAYSATGQRKSKLITDIYVGYGIGDVTSDVNMKFSRVFIQPGIGVGSPWFDASFNPRLCYLSFSDFNPNGRDSTYLDANGLYNYDFNYSIADQSYLFFEPAITLRGGYKFIKIQLQGVFSIQTKNLPWSYHPTRFTAGLYLTLEDMFNMSGKRNRY